MDDPSASSRYQLTVLGIFASSKGEHLENLLFRYLEYVRKRFHLDPGAKQISSYDVQAALQLSREDWMFLGKVIQTANWASGGMAILSDGTWQAGVPKDVDDIPENPKAYIQDKLFAFYDPSAPVLLAHRYQKVSSSVTAIVELWFVKDEALRVQLESDWKEAKATRGAKAWKSCVIMCGGILEGLLLDCLKQESAAVISSQMSLNKKTNVTIDSWTLSEMIDTTKRWNILAKEAVHVGHALREYRNLVPPSKQVKEKIVVTEAEASLSFSGIQVCIAEFARHAERRGNVTKGPSSP